MTNDNDQNIQNDAPNQGAQGQFHGDVNTGTQQDVSGERAVGIGGDANAPVTTGDQNTNANVQGDNTGQNVGVNYGTVKQDIHLPTPEQRPHQLRAPVADFVGRTEEITDLTAALTGGSGATICGVRGMGGIGKTELALVVANQLAEQFTDGQLVVELFGASNPVSPEAALQAAIRAFEPQAKLPDDLPALKQWYAACLNGKRVLVLADDARDAAQVRPLHPPAGCALLVTSRQTFTLPGMRRFDLGTLAEEEAIKLLLDIAPHIGEDAPALAELCGYLPLALRVSADLLANDDTRSVTRYLEQLQAERLKHLADPDNPDDPEASVEASLALSYAALPPAARQTLAQLGVFVGDFTLAAAAAVLAIPDTQSPIPDTLGRLRRRSLLEYDAATERYDLHDLVRAFALARLEEWGMQNGELRMTAPPFSTLHSQFSIETRLRHARYYEQVAMQAETAYREGKPLDGLALFDRERRQIDAGWDWAMRSAERKAQRAEPDPAMDELLLDFANATAYIGDLRYDLRRERIPHLEAQRDAARRLGRKDHEGTALGNLGNAYNALGEYQRAIETFEQLLVMNREMGDRRNEGNTLGNLGIAYDNLGDYPRAIDYHEQYLAIAREIGDRRGAGNALGNLGSAYAALGDYPHAIAFHEQYLAIAREIGDRRGAGNALGNLGSAYKNLGEYQRAIAFHEQALVISREIGDRRGEGNTQGSLGIAYANLGEYRRAIDYHEQYLAIAREIGDRRGEGSALGSLGLAYADLGEYRRAIDYHEQYLAIAREIGNRRGEGSALGSLGLAYADLGEYRRAIELYEQQLVIVREIGDRRGEGSALGNLGIAYRNLGEYRRAIELYEQCRDIAREIGDRRGEGNALEALGIAYQNLDDPATARDYYEQARDIWQTIGDVASAARLSWNLGTLYEAQGELARAVELMQVWVDFLQQIGHPKFDDSAAYLETVRQKLADQSG
jgi:tetratricopeptide (TPR) repeat protein